MTILLRIHPDNPQQRLSEQAAQILSQGGVLACPTDSGYALGCCLGNKEGLEKIRAIRGFDRNHYFTLLCRDLSEVGRYAKINTPTFRLLKAHTPGPYTFLLPATRVVPRRLLHEKRRTIGLRIPAHAITLSLLEALDAPLMGVSLYPSDAEVLGVDGYTVFEALDGRVDMVIDGGYCVTAPTTVVDCLGESPEVVRPGQGGVEVFQ